MSIIETMTAALGHHRAGRLREADALYREVLRLEPEHADALHLLAMVAHQSGQDDVASAYIDRAISANPSNPVYHRNAGIVRHAQGRVDQAVASYRAALSLRHDYAEAHNGLGNALRHQGKLDDAEDSFRTAVSFSPGFSDAWINLGNVLLALGRPDESIASYRRALSIEPKSAHAHYNLGNALREKGLLADAIASYRAALALAPDDAEARHNLGAAYEAQGNATAAIEAYAQALESDEAPQFKASFVRILTGGQIAQASPTVRNVVRRAISAPWARPVDLAKACIRLIASNPDIEACIERAARAWPARLTALRLFGPAGLAALSGDALLHALLENAPVCDLALERLLTLARHVILEAAEGEHAVDADTLRFACALARQCHINEFVFSCTDEEASRVRAVRERLVDALRDDASAPAIRIAAIAAYGPLLSLPFIQNGTGRLWPESVAGVLVQQISEPLAERRHREGIARLTAIDDGVSTRVREQYEENPYPRWVRLPAEPAKGDARLAPLLNFQTEQARGLDILVAGCGTGQEAIEIAQQLPASRVLAIDLSLGSLCYAKRKTAELERDNIEYAQADILRLASIGRRFDFISSVGVLHHLANPMAGWKELLSLLRPRGLMLIGLYSESGRRTLTAARQFIADRGYVPNPADIRRCRQDLMSGDRAAEFIALAALTDFYVTSECRDLLFHVQEHCFTLPGIGAALETLDLSLEGFLLDPRVADAYSIRFPDDAAMTNLDNWNTLETDVPLLFSGMYVFWVRKRKDAWLKAAVESPGQVC